jgi:hypothetical protein
MTTYETTAEDLQEQAAATTDTSATTTNDSIISSSISHGRPWDGMCCLCTMEDITEENYVEYQSFPSLVWKPSLFEKCVVEELLQTQFTKYLERVQTTDCMSELRRLVNVGPPIYLSDSHALPLATDQDTHICQLWYSSTTTNDSSNINDDTNTDNNSEGGGGGEYRSSILQGAYTGKDRDELWDQLKILLSTQEQKQQQQQQQQQEQQQEDIQEESVDDARLDGY